MASYPNLLHPVTVTIAQFDSDSTVYDDEAREPVQQAARSTEVELPGQVSYGSSRELSYELGGRRENERGYVLFRQVDLDAKSVTLQPNDRITKIGQVVQDAYITRLEPKGHYSGFAGHTLVKAHFADREPSKQRRSA